MTGLFDKVFSTKRPTATDGDLGEMRLWGEEFHLADVPCALQQQKSQELGETTDKVSTRVVTHKLWFPLGTDLVDTDQVFVAGVKFDVVSVEPDVAGVGNHGAAMLRELRS